MTVPTIFDLCAPRPDVLQGTIAESDFAADLAQVLRGDAPEEYRTPARFFANTHPTRGLKDLLRNVCLRLSGSPQQVASIFRLDTNYLVFLVADAARKDEMRHMMTRRLALEEIRRPERLNELADHQRDRVLEWYRRSEQELALAIQQCYRHVFYASRNRVEGAEVDLAHTAIDAQSASEKPGDGQKQVVRALRDNNKLRLPEDEPDSPTYIRDRTPLKKGTMTTAALRAEFRRDPALPILVGDDVFVKGVRRGIELGEYVYQSGDLTCGQGDPWASIHIDEQSFVHTAQHAKFNAIWPKSAEPKGPLAPGGEGGPQPGPSGDPQGISTGGPGSGTGLEKPPRGGGQPGGLPGGPQPDANILSEEGILKEALTKLWERARARRFERIAGLELKLYEPADAFRLLGVVGAAPGAQKKVTLEGGYETLDGGTLELNFEGPLDDAQPVKDFLDPQLRAAKEKDLTVTFALTFNEGLSLADDAPEKLTERLTRFGTGAAYVAATLEARS